MQAQVRNVIDASDIFYLGRQSFDERQRTMRLYVGNLNYRTSEDELASLFGEYGNVDSAVIISDRETGRSKGFGFIEFTNDEDALKAIDAMNGKDMEGRPLKVNEARPREDSRGGGGGGGGGGGRRY
jgi:cold-inducible RNA-binding protein